MATSSRYRQPLRLTLALGLGLAFVPARAVVVPDPPAQAGSAAVEALKARIDGDNRNHPAKSVAWAQEGLAMLGPDGSLADRLWFLAALSRDANLLNDTGLALDTARKGQALVGDHGAPVDRARFGILAARALLAADKVSEALAEHQRIAGLLTDLAKSQDADSRSQAAQGWRTLGTIQLNLAHFPEAMEAYTRALRLYDSLGDARGQSLTYDAMAGIHSRLGRYQEAEAATLKALEYGAQAKDEGLLAGFHLSLSNTYGRMANPDRQLKELETAHAMAVRAQDANTALTATVNLADVSLQQKDYAATLRHAEEAMALAEQAKDFTSLAICRINKGIALNRLGRPGGLALVQQGLDHFKQRGPQNYVPEVTGILAEEYAFARDWEKAYRTHVTFKDLSDAELRSADQKRIAEAQAAYQSEKQQQQIAALQKDRQNQARFRNLWILAGLLGLSAAGILILGRKRLEAANKALEDMALRDPLTGLANRRYLTTRIDEDLAQIRRLHRVPAQAGARAADRFAANIDVVFMMLDIDHFKQVNDQHGHAAGDAVLRQFAAILGRTLRDSDTVVRWGGEEFFVVAKHASRMDAHILAERIRRAVAGHAFDLGEGTKLHKTCSIGFACYPFLQDGKSPVAWETIVEMADQCLYAAKHSGRDMWVGIRPCDMAPDLLSAHLHGWIDVAQCVKQGAIEASWTDGRALSWPA